MRQAVPFPMVLLLMQLLWIGSMNFLMNWSVLPQA